MLMNEIKWTADGIWNGEQGKSYAKIMNNFIIDDIFAPPLTQWVCVYVQTSARVSYDAVTLHLYQQAMRIFTSHCSR